MEMEEGRVSTRSGDGGGVKRQWERLRDNIERNMATHVSESPRRQHCVKITCPIMKRDCSPCYLRCFTVHSPSLSSHIHIPCIYLDAVIYCL